MPASFEEKSVWIQFVGTGLALGGYFLVAGSMLARGVTAMPAYAALFIIATIVLVVLLVAGHVVAAIASRPEGRDERDRLIAWRAEAGSGWLLAVGVLAGVTAMVFAIETVFIAHLLLLSLFASEMLGFALRLRFYRKGV